MSVQNGWECNMSLKHKILCSIGNHKYVPVLRTYSHFSTDWTDTGETDYWSAHFLECKYCKERRFETNYAFTTKNHRGLQQAKDLWLDRGYIPDSLKNPNKYEKPKKPKTQNNTVLTNNDKINKMLLKALDTDSDSEAQTCFRMARKTYRDVKSKTT